MQRLPSPRLPSLPAYNGAPRQSRTAHHASRSSDPNKQIKSEFIRALKKTYPKLPDATILDACDDISIGPQFYRKARTAIATLTNHAAKVPPTEGSVRASEDEIEGDNSTTAAAEARSDYEKFVKLIQLTMDEADLRAAVKAKISPESIEDMLSLGLDHRLALRSLKAGCTKDMLVKAFTQAGIPEEKFRSHIEAYNRANLPITPDTIVRWSDSAISKSETGERNFSSIDFKPVFKVRYKNNATGKDERWVFKSLPSNGASFGVPLTFLDAMGIDPSDPKLAERSIATHQFAELLGFDVVAKVEIAIHALPSQVDRDSPTAGMAWSFAPGKSSFYTPQSVMDDPRTKRQLFMLQTLDYLTGQTDRHAENYVIAYAEQRGGAACVKVTGIDSELSFGCGVHPEEYKPFSAAVGLPPVIDVEMAAAIEKLEVEQIRTKLDGKLSRAEVQACEKRLALLKEHVQTLRARDAVIAVEDWSKNPPNVTRENSYWARDRAPLPFERT